MAHPDAKRFWKELLRRRVVRVAVFYIAGAWILAQAIDLLLDAFDASHYMRFVVAGLGVGLPVALVLAWVFDITPSGIERTPDRPEPADPPPAAPESSIAVLPFANLSQDVENEYFSDGLSEEIRNQLARVPGLRVAARTSSFAFKGRHEDVREIGRRLNVATVLEGGVRKQADTVRIDVQLVGAADGYQIWSETFERRLDDIFRLQSEVASAVIAAIGPRRTGDERAPSPPATQSVEAYAANVRREYGGIAELEGSYPFTLDRSSRAYRLNRYLHGIIQPELRGRFLYDREGSYVRGELSEEEKDMLRRLDWRALIRYGVIFFILEKLGAAVGSTNQHIYAHMRGETLDQFQKTRKNAVLYSVAGTHKAKAKAKAEKDSAAKRPKS